MLRFDANPKKAKANLLKHGVSFEEAASVFLDPRAITFADPDASQDEDRERTYGFSNHNRLLVVAHTDRGQVVRIISARKANKDEQEIYAEG